MERLFSDKRIETKQATLSCAMEQFIDRKEGRRYHQSPHVSQEWDEEGNPWGLDGYIECLEHTIECWSHDGDYERTRRWIETVTVLP